MATVQEANVKEKNEAAEKPKSIAEAALSEALPALHAAAVAVNVLKKDSYLGWGSWQKPTPRCLE